jgi:hypothetical protein
MSVSSHDIIIRTAFLLPEGQREPDWSAAEAALAAMSETDLSVLSVEALSGWLPEWLDEWGPEPQAEGERYRKYLSNALADAVASWRAGWPVHNEIAFYHYPHQWHGRIGALVMGVGFDDPPEGVAPVLALDAAGILAAAGFETMP